MKGLYKGEYLIVLYDKDDLPLFVAANGSEFAELYTKYSGIKCRSTPYTILRHILTGRSKNSKIRLIKADTVTDDCFKEADEDFINFIEKTRKKSLRERADELGVPVRTMMRKSPALKRKTEEQK